MSKHKADQTDHLLFPSGRNVKSCRADAKKLKAAAKAKGEKLSYSKALDLIAVQNGVNLSWHKAIAQIKAEASSPSLPLVEIVRSPSQMVSSTTMPGVLKAGCDYELVNYIETLPEVALPKHFEMLVRQPFDLKGIDFQIKYGIRNEQGYVYRVINVSSPAQHILLMKKLEEFGFFSVSTINHKANEKEYNLVFAVNEELHIPEWDGSRPPVTLTKQLMRELVDWLFYLDSEPPIDNNDDFRNLRINRTNWTFDMCAIYWKFAVELTGEPLDEEPSQIVEDIIRYTTKCAVSRFNSEYDRLYM
ncbi:glyoxalase superfamily protein [uncultured Photobacterium sp.]|uniref:glyoxalase superfamily protein n=1 Tax=uncultured Photobacterium sp. TaxID=173973 RepID=UPI002621FC49|nr:glyoxalase superfamily protein [uncultured Photobacterium sp.]